MRTSLLLFPALLVACGQTGEEGDTVVRCTVVSSVEVPNDDASLGFSAEDAVATLDGRAWDVAWQDDELYAGSSLTRLTTTAGFGAGAVRKLELAELDQCEYVGTFLLVPTTLGFSDADATFAASGSSAGIAVFGLSDDDTHLDYGEEDILVSTLPADLAEAGEAALPPSDDTARTFSVALEGAASALLLHLQVVDGNSLAAVASAELSGM
ncbi:MAG: hypothetical protein V4850_05045 [Myxococcota bacterium]